MTAAQGARLAQIAATAAASSGPGKYQQAGGALGAVAGTVIGGRFGPAGAAAGQVVGQKVGEKIGERLDDPLLPLTKAAKFTGQAVEQLGIAATSVAGNDGVGLFKQGISATSKALEEVPFAGKFAAAGLRTFGSAVTATGDVLDAFAARAKQIQNYSGAIASASARQDVALLKADIAEAQMMSQGWAKLIDKQTQLELMVRELLMPLKAYIVDQLPSAIDAAMTALVGFLKFMEFTSPIVLVLGRKISEDVEKIRKKAEEAVAEGTDLLGPLLEGIEGLAAPIPMAAPAAVAAPPAIALP